MQTPQSSFTLAPVLGLSPGAPTQHNAQLRHFHPAPGVPDSAGPPRGIEANSDPLGLPLDDWVSHLAAMTQQLDSDEHSADDPGHSAGVLLPNSTCVQSSTDVPRDTEAELGTGTHAESLASVAAASSSHQGLHQQLQVCLFLACRPLGSSSCP